MPLTLGGKIAVQFIIKDRLPPLEFFASSLQNTFNSSTILPRTTSSHALSIPTHNLLLQTVTHPSRKDELSLDPPCPPNGHLELRLGRMAVRAGPITGGTASLPENDGPVHHNPLLLPRDEGPAWIHSQALHVR